MARRLISAERMPEAMKRVGRGRRISTDDNLLLEYSTPRGNVFGGEAFDRNLAALKAAAAGKAAPAPEPAAPHLSHPI
jgi:hypothetical protein